jgi:hypothetical protein
VVGALRKRMLQVGKTGMGKDSWPEMKQIYKYNKE